MEIHEAKRIGAIIDVAHGVNVSGKCSPPLPEDVLKELEGCPEIIGDRFYEWKWSRMVGEMLAEELQEYGIETAYTIEPSVEKEIGLPQRMYRANNLFVGQTRLFISLHVNAVGDGTKFLKADFGSIWTTIGETISDPLATEIYKELAEEFKDEDIYMRGEFSDGDPDYEANFYVTRKAKMPAVLIEFGFHTNLKNIKFLTKQETKRRYAKAVARGVANYYGL